MMTPATTYSMHKCEQECAARVVADRCSCVDAYMPGKIFQYIIDDVLFLLHPSSYQDNLYINYVVKHAYIIVLHFIRIYLSS